MKKPNYILVLAAALAFVAVLTPLAQAQVNAQVPGQGAVVTGRVALSKGQYETFSYTTVAGLTPTITTTTTGTLSVANITGQAEIATVTTTITGTLDKKSIVRGKIGNKELLQLILNTTDPAALRGQSLVFVDDKAGFLEGNAFAAPNGSGQFIGAAKLSKTATPTVTVRTWNNDPALATANKLGVNGGGNVDFLTSAIASKKTTNEVTITGYGNAGIEVRAAVSAYTKSLIGQVVNLDFTVFNFGNVKDTQQRILTGDPNYQGVVTNGSKGTLSPRNLFGGVQKTP